ncbi:hypothetical protein ABWK22_02050 [Gottfriedia acidiceleris]|uniref:hypothetical protein n=1 Tax=Gottfriedia acidiceleris TaxID=371036 RepID=UPI003392D981
MRRKESVFPIFNDNDFIEFMTKGTESVYECQVASRYSERKEEASILKLALKNANVLPFIVMNFNKELYSGKSFGRMYNEDVDGVYLVEENAIIFSSSYRAEEFTPLIKDITVYTADNLEKQMQEHLLYHLREAVSLKRALGVESEPEYVSIGQITSWYVNGKKPIDYIGQSADMIRPIREELLPLMIKFIRGEDILDVGLKEFNIDNYAAVLAFVEQKFVEFDSSPEMLRNVKLLQILKGDLSSAVNVTVVKKDGTQIKVENNVRNLDDTFKIGRYSQEVFFTEIDYFMYKKKTYGKVA